MLRPWLWYSFNKERCGFYGGIAMRHVVYSFYHYEGRLHFERILREAA